MVFQKYHKHPWKSIYSAEEALIQIEMYSLFLVDQHVHRHNPTLWNTKEKLNSLGGYLMELF